MPSVTTYIEADGAVSVTVEASADDELANLAIESLADESSKTAIATWMTLYQARGDQDAAEAGGDDDAADDS